MKVAISSLILLAGTQAWALPWPSSKGSTGGDIQLGVQKWKSMQQCIEELSARLPAEAASQALGTDPLEVICASRQAAAKDDPDVCRREVKDYNQRSTCLRFFALYTGRPHDCPQRGWPTYHEGLCVALASRQPSLCRAAPDEQQPLCRAILQGDSHCSSLRAERRAACRREAAAWRSLMKPLPAALPGAFSATLEVRASAVGSGLNLPAGAAQFKSRVLDHGVLLADQGGSGDWFCIDRNFAPQETYDYRGLPPLDLELQVPLPTGGTGTVSVGGSGGGQAKVSFREGGSYRSRTLQASSGSVSISRLSRRPAGEVSGTFSLELTDGVDRLKVDGEFRTFVRELVPLTAVASYMNYRTGSGASRSYFNRGSLTPEEVKRYQARIVKVKDGLYDVDTSVRADILQDTSKLTESAYVNQDYRTKAFRLYSVTRNGLLGLLGFMDNDIIRKINGREIKTREDFYDVYGKFKRAATITVLVERSNVESKITYRFKKVTARAAGKSD
jgi:hypothetical protein